MTVIAYRDGILASDSQVGSSLVIKSHPARKIYRAHDGGMLGATGTLAVIGPLLRLLQKREPADNELPDIGDAVVVRVMPDMSVREYSHTSWCDYGRIPHGAWGSGCEAATAALLMDASARRAVEIACMVVPTCGGAVQWMRFRDPLDAAA